MATRGAARPGTEPDILEAGRSTASSLSQEQITEFVYVVIQKGVYRHSILGAFPGDEAGLAQALECGWRGIEAENDHYHDAEIVKVPFGPSDAAEEVVETLCWLPDGPPFPRVGPGRVVTRTEYNAERKERRRSDDDRRRREAQSRINGG